MPRRNISRDEAAAMSRDIGIFINGEYDPLFDFSKYYNPSAEDKEAAKKLEEKYKKLADERGKTNNSKN